PRELIVELAAGSAARRFLMGNEHRIGVARAVEVRRFVGAAAAGAGRVLARGEDDRNDEALRVDLVRGAAARRSADPRRGLADDQVVGLAAQAVGLEVRGMRIEDGAGGRRDRARAARALLGHRVAYAVLPRVD